jgi:hypothetical protein
MKKLKPQIPRPKTSHSGPPKGSSARSYSECERNLALVSEVVMVDSRQRLYGVLWHTDVGGGEE